MSVIIKDINILQPRMQKRVKMFLKRCPQIFITETARTALRQRQLIQEGYSKYL